jgi:hypothetical protein
MLSESELDTAGEVGVPKLSPDFLIETYLDHQVGPPLLPGFGSHECA